MIKPKAEEIAEQLNRPLCQIRKAKTPLDAQQRNHIIIKLLRSGYSPHNVAGFMGLTEEEVLSLIR